MRNRNLKLKLMLALPVVAMLAIPGATAPMAESLDNRPSTVDVAETGFGLFLDPHAEPVLRFAPAATNRSL